MPAPLTPAEIVRRLVAWRDMHKSHHKRQIAEHLGIETSCFCEWTRGFDEDRLDDHLAEAEAALDEDDAFLRRVVAACDDNKTRSAAARGAEVIEHPTLAGRNAYAARQGLRSLRRAMAHIYHRETGEVNTVTTSPEMIDDARMA